MVAARMMDRGPMGPTRMELTKPVIAAIEGYVNDDFKSILTYMSGFFLAVWAAT